MSDHRYQDSLHCDTGGLPSKERVKWAAKALEVPWWEAAWMRGYYAGLRFKAFMGKERLFIGPVGLNGWYPFKVLAVAAFVLMALWIAAG